jgi:hypothetical protein
MNRFVGWNDGIAGVRSIVVLHGKQSNNRYGDVFWSSYPDASKNASVLLYFLIRGLLFSIF